MLWWERRDHGLTWANKESGLGRKGMVGEGGDKIRKSRPS